MDKLDRLGWTEGFSVSSFGLEIGLRSNDATILQRLTGLLPPGWRPSDAKVVGRLYSVFVGGPNPDGRSRRFSLLYSDLGRIARTHDLEAVCGTFERDLAGYVAEFGKDRAFIHAGVVGWRGKAILLPGRSFTGKSTLVAELVRAGATYYSDEYAVLDEDGLVHPYARPISLRDERQTNTRRFTAESIGGEVGATPLPVGLILITRYRERARWNPRPLTPGQAAIALLAQANTARNDPATTLVAIQRAAAYAKGIKGNRPDAAQIAQALLERA